jgi:PAS domain S-box-containing protein
MPRALVADDLPENRYMLESLLRGHGYEVLSVTNGAQALEAARRDPPDLVISDILMPVMDGFSLCRAWKHDSRLKSIPFVFYTATYTDPKDERFAMSLGADRFIIKPMEPEVFVGAIAKLLREASGGALGSGMPEESSEAGYLKEYNETLTRKLERKLVQLEQANFALLGEIAERKKVERALRESTAQLRGVVHRSPVAIVGKEHEILLLNELNEPEVEIAPVLQRIVNEAREVVDAEYAALGIAVSEELPFDPWVFSGMTKEQASKIGRNPRPAGLLRAPLPEERALRIPDVHRSADFRGLPDHHPAIVSFMRVPIRHDGHIVGLLYFANKRGMPEFTDDDERAMELFASQAGVAVHQGHLEEQIDVDRARFRAIVENAPHGVHFVEAGTQRVFANRRALELAGQSSVTTLADYKGVLCSPDGKPLPLDETPARRVLRGETLKPQEILLRRPDGREVPVLVNAVPIRRPDGHCQGVVVVYEDISMLKELQRLREEWVALVAHDLRQPLNTITIYVSMLQRIADHPDPQLLRKGLERTRRAANTLNRMINDLSDLSRTEAKHLELERGSLDLAVLVGEVVERHRLASPDRIINLQVHGSVPRIDADALRIEQVVGNILTNALKYSEPGTAIEVEVRGVKHEAGVRVTNQGPCIPPEELPALFERYYRTARARAGPARGLGLGLYIARGIIEGHGGRIWAESRAGETTFQFTLPAAPTSE